MALQQLPSIFPQIVTTLTVSRKKSYSFTIPLSSILLFYCIFLTIILIRTAFRLDHNYMTHMVGIKSTLADKIFTRLNRYIHMEEETTN